MAGEIFGPYNPSVSASSESKASSMGVSFEKLGLDMKLQCYSVLTAQLWVRNQGPVMGITV
jgi:hypothetical protein